jgi:hypothetical protein
VSVTVRILALPFTLKLILPFAVGIDPLLVPLLKPDTEVFTVDHDKLPAPSVCKYCPAFPPVIITLPTAFKLLLPVTDKLPATLAPLSVITTTLALPFTLKLILPLAFGIDPLLVPLLKPDTEVVTVDHDKLPAPAVC